MCSKKESLQFTGWLSALLNLCPRPLHHLRPTIKSSNQRGRVENRFSPILPHQTVHAVFPHTAFRCSSCHGMRITPTRNRRNLVQPVAFIKVGIREVAVTASFAFHFMALHQVRAQALFRMDSGLAQHPAGVSIVKVVRPASQAAVHVSHDVIQCDVGQFPSRQCRQLRLDLL